MEKGKAIAFVILLLITIGFNPTMNLVDRRANYYK